MRLWGAVAGESGECCSGSLYIEPVVTHGVCVRKPIDLLQWGRPAAAAQCGTRTILPLTVVPPVHTVRATLSADSLVAVEFQPQIICTKSRVVAQIQSNLRD